MLISLICSSGKKIDESYFKELFSSLINNDYKDFECLFLVAPGEGNAKGLIEEATKGDNRFRVLDGFVSLSETRLVGAREAKGEYLYFFDIDDVLAKDGLAKLANEAKKGYDIVMGNFYYLRGKKAKKSAFKVKGELTNKKAVKLLLADIYIRAFLWNKLFKRSLFEGTTILPPLYGEKKSNIHSEDIIFLTPLLYKAQSIKGIKDPVYYYRKADFQGSLSYKYARKDRALTHLLSFEFVGAYLKDIDAKLYSIYIQKLRRFTFSLAYDLSLDKKAGAPNYPSYKKSLKQEMKRIKKEGPFAKDSLFKEIDFNSCLTSF